MCRVDVMHFFVYAGHADKSKILTNRLAISEEHIQHRVVSSVSDVIQYIQRKYSYPLPMVGTLQLKYIGVECAKEQLDGNAEV